MDQPSSSHSSSSENSLLATRRALRFLTCGSVDDGKSTLIGRMLYEQGLIFDDHMTALQSDSRKHGTTGEEIDFALLLDGLEAEREQGITIDVAYRYFATPRRHFIVADAPGHEQYTRNMATGASNSDLAVILVDASKGLMPQTRRHAIIASLLGIRYIVLAVNKIDLVDFRQDVFDRIVAEFTAFAATLAFKDIRPIPLAARFGDNVLSSSSRTPWYDGPSLIAYLEAVEIDEDGVAQSFRMPVQWVNRPNAGYRGFAGTVAAGAITPGDAVVVLPSGQTSQIKKVLGPQGAVDHAGAGTAVTVTLTSEIDIARGDMLVAPDRRPQVADQFAAHLVWMSSDRLLPGRSYLMKINHVTLTASVTELKHRIDVENLDKLAAKTLAMNEIGVANLSLARSVPFDAYADNRTTGAFILIDRYSNETVAAGMIDFALRRATNIHYQPITVTKAERTQLMTHKPMVLWFTGLSGAGKSTVANLVEASLHARGVHTTLLDGDNIRHGLNKDLGFTAGERVENIRRIGEVAKLMTEAGLVVLCSFISPFRAERRMVRELLPDGEFIEIFVDAHLDACIARDPKGLYRRALAGEIKNFTGVDQPYEQPERAELTLDTAQNSAATLADQVVAELIRRRVF
ncbi:MAG: sulfate adenylyltransferase subunit CysN [Bradyrhizobium sp.]|nr:sulfate adenylyltransferase subunit CysN [Bradyrhizobium sp.]